MNWKMKGFLSFVLMLAVLVVFLKLMNWLPASLHFSSARPYASIEEAQAALDVDKIFVPKYFPNSITWPPVRVLAQKKPFAAVIMEFAGTGTGDPDLIIAQAASPGFAARENIKVRQVKEVVEYKLKGRRATLTVGTCKDDACSMVSWDEGGYRVNVLMKSPPFELVRIAESMLP